MIKMHNRYPCGLAYLTADMIFCWTAVGARTGDMKLVGSRTGIIRLRMKQKLTLVSELVGMATQLEPHSIYACCGAPGVHKLFNVE